MTFIQSLVKIACLLHLGRHITYRLSKVWVYSQSVSTSVCLHEVLTVSYHPEIVSVPIGVYLFYHYSDTGEELGV